jgi:hypothetical protein
MHGRVQPDDFRRFGPSRRGEVPAGQFAAEKCGRRQGEGRPGFCCGLGANVIITV